MDLFQQDPIEIITSVGKKILICKRKDNKRYMKMITSILAIVLAVSSFRHSAQACTLTIGVVAPGQECIITGPVIPPPEKLSVMSGAILRVYADFSVSTYIESIGGIIEIGGDVTLGADSMSFEKTDIACNSRCLFVTNNFQLRETKIHADYVNSSGTEGLLGLQGIGGAHAGPSILVVEPNPVVVIAAYGDFMEPLDMGLAGDNDPLGRNYGGGAIRIDTTAFFMDELSEITARGGPGKDGYSGGSGGSVWISSHCTPESTPDRTAVIDISGGDAECFGVCAQGGSGGRLAWTCKSGLAPRIPFGIAKGGKHGDLEEYAAAGSMFYQGDDRAIIHTREGAERFYSSFTPQILTSTVLLVQRSLSNLEAEIGTMADVHMMRMNGSPSQTIINVTKYWVYMHGQGHVVDQSPLLDLVIHATAQPTKGPLDPDCSQGEFTDVHVAQGETCEYVGITEFASLTVEGTLILHRNSLVHTTFMLLPMAQLILYDRLSQESGEYYFAMADLFSAELTAKESLSFEGMQMNAYNTFRIQGQFVFLSPDTIIDGVGRGYSDPYTSKGGIGSGVPLRGGFHSSCAGSACEKAISLTYRPYGDVLRPKDPGVAGTIGGAHIPNDAASGRGGSAVHIRAADLYCMGQILVDGAPGEIIGPGVGIGSGSGGSIFIEINSGDLSYCILSSNGGGFSSPAGPENVGTGGRISIDYGLDSAGFDYPELDYVSVLGGEYEPGRRGSPGTLVIHQRQEHVRNVYPLDTAVDGPVTLFFTFESAVSNLKSLALTSPDGGVTFYIDGKTIHSIPGEEDCEYTHSSIVSVEREEQNEIVFGHCAQVSGHLGIVFLDKNTPASNFVQSTETISLVVNEVSVMQYVTQSYEDILVTNAEPLQDALYSERLYYDALSSCRTNLTAMTGGETVPEFIRSENPQPGDILIYRAFILPGVGMAWNSFQAESIAKQQMMLLRSILLYPAASITFLRVDMVENIVVGYYQVSVPHYATNAGDCMETVISVR